MIRNLSVSYQSHHDLEQLVKYTKGVPASQILLQVFCGVLDQAVIRDLRSQLIQYFPGVAIIGSSTAGEIVDGESQELTIVINATLFAHTKVVSAITCQNDDLMMAGDELGNALKHPDTRVAIVFGCGIKNKKTIKGQALLSAIQAQLPGVTLAGGHAGDNGKGETTFVFTEHDFTEHGVVAAALVGKRIKADNAYNLSWVPIGKKLTITKVEGSRVYGINNQTPYDVYCHYLGKEVADNLPLSAVDFPFIIEKDGVAMAIHATGINEDGSFEYMHDFHVGEQLRFGFCHAGLLASGAKETHARLLQQQPEVLFVYACVSRKWILGDDIAVDLSSVVDVAPSAGFFCYGEYFHRDCGKACFLSQTMTALSLTESLHQRSSEISYSQQANTPDEHSRQFRTMRVLHRLVDTSTREIEAMNQELDNLVRLDSLTGLSNRRRFDERLKAECARLNQTGASLSLLLLDVDYFKPYNDTYGHVAGDSCLRGIAEVLREVIYGEHVTVARYGGEEFACILPEVDYPDALAIAERVRHQINHLYINHSSSEIADHVTASFGVLTVCCDKLVAGDEFVHACDELLYQAKHSGRNQVVGKVVGKDAS